MGKRYKYTVSGDSIRGSQEVVNDIDTAYEAEYWENDLGQHFHTNIATTRVRRGRQQ